MTLAGSRNAVVALKLVAPVSLAVLGVGKQERRGGIETGPCLPQGPGRREKQERRGGIETDENVVPRLRDPSEAGTPWWH